MNGNQIFYTGIVEDIRDPQQRGRVRVRIDGLYGPSITTTDIPWSVPLGAVSSAGLSGVGHSPVGMMVGSSVIVVFLDGPDMQIPMVMGTLNPAEGGGAKGLITRMGIKDATDNFPANLKFDDAGIPPWLTIARQQVGIKRSLPGQTPDTNIVKYLETVGYHGKDTTPWCSAFVTWCLRQGGIAVPGATASAKSWLTFGQVEKVTDPLAGSIAVFNVGGATASGCHVAFLEGFQGSRVRVTGGNQTARHEVTTQFFPKSWLLGLMWPKGFAKDAYRAKTG